MKVPFTEARPFTAAAVREPTPFNEMNVSAGNGQNDPQQAWYQARISALEAENKRLREALTWTHRVSEMTGNMCRDTRRTKASGPVQAMVNKIAAQFDRIAGRAKAALEG